MNKTEKKVLEKIRSGEVKMKPKWWFVAQSAGMSVVFWMSILVAVVGASYLWYFLDLYRPTEWGEYSELGLGLIMEDFPVYGSVALILAGMLGSWMSLRIGDNYKKDWWKMAIKTWGIIVFGLTGWLMAKMLL